MKKEKGLTLYIAIIIMVILLAIVLGISTILVSQLKIVKGMEKSIVAFYAADTGIEHVLMDRSDPTVFNACTTEASPCVLDNGAEYYVQVLVFGVGGCTADNYCIRSVGAFGGVKRAIEASY